MGPESRFFTQRGLYMAVLVLQHEHSQASIDWTAFYTILTPYVVLPNKLYLVTETNLICSQVDTPNHFWVWLFSFVHRVILCYECRYCVVYTKIAKTSSLIYDY